MSDAEDVGQATGRTRARIIERSQEACYQARSQFRRAVSSGADGGTIGAARAELHNAVFDYYEALKPLRNDDNIAEEWSETELWSETVPKRREDGSIVFKTDDSGTVVGYATEEELVTLDDLGEYATRTTETTKEITGLLGTRQATKTDPQRLPAHTLLTVADTLDDLAAKLGFAPETPEELPSDTI